MKPTKERTMSIMHFKCPECDGKFLIFTAETTSMNYQRDKENKIIGIDFNVKVLKGNCSCCNLIIIDDQE